MDGLENIANRAENFERETADDQTYESVNDSEAPGVIPGVDPLAAAANRAEVLLKIMGSAAAAFIDNRLILPDQEIAAGREGLAPLLAKYNLAGDGNGNLPYQEEITAGLYLGGLWRRFRKALAVLRAIDKAEAEKQKREQEQANHGDQRKHQPEKQQQPVSGDVRLREVSDSDAPGWLTQPGGAGSPVG